MAQCHAAGPPDQATVAGAARDTVYVGHALPSRSRTVTKRGMREGGVVIDERDIIDQRGRFTCLVARHPSEAQAKIP